MSIKPLAALGLLLCMAIIPLFCQLDSMPLRQWDEARLSVSALEMTQTHNLLIPTYEGVADMWSTKPPFMIWCQALSLSCLGINELAVRLPSAIAGLCTVLIIFFFFSRKYKMPLAGLLCSVVLLTTQGYLFYGHSVRTGDYDAMLTLFTTAYCLSFFLFMDGRGRRYLYGVFLFITLAVLTKGVQALLFLPCLLLFALYKRRLLMVLRNKHFYFGLAASLLIVAFYYLLREHYNAGYLKAVQQNELGGRYSKTLEGHNEPAWLIFQFFLHNYFSEWSLLFLPALLTGLLSRRPHIKDMAVFSTLLVVVYMAIILGAKTRLPWYIMPAFPFVAVIVGLCLYQFCELLSGPTVNKQVYYANMLPAVFLVFIFYTPYAHVCTAVFTPEQEPYLSAYERSYGLYLKDALNYPQRHDGRYYTLNSPANQSVVWYFTALAILHRPVIDIRFADLKPGMYVIPGNQESRDYIDSHFNTQFNWQDGALAYYRLLSPKLTNEADTIKN